jgi:hypothetical protein
MLLCMAVETCPTPELPASQSRLSSRLVVVAVPRGRYLRCLLLALMPTWAQ